MGIGDTLKEIFVEEGVIPWITKHVEEAYKKAKEAITGGEEADQDTKVATPEKARELLLDKPIKSLPSFAWDVAEKLHKVYSFSPNYRDLPDEKKTKILWESLNRPDKILEIINKDPYLRIAFERADDKAKQNFLSLVEGLKTRSVPQEEGLREPYLDPTTWLGVGAVAGVKALRSVIAGDIIGERERKTSLRSLHGQRSSVVDRRRSRHPCWAFARSRESPQESQNRRRSGESFR